MTMTINTLQMRTGNVRFFSGEPDIVRMMEAILCIADTPEAERIPRLFICDGDDPAQCAALKNAGTDTPVLFYTAAPAQFIPPALSARYTVIPRPFLFRDFRRAAAELYADSEESAARDTADAHEAPPLSALPIRVIDKAAVWQSIRVPLSPAEAGVLRILTDAYPDAASRAQLESVFSRRGKGTLSVYISCLRKKLSAIPSFRTIVSVKGGFALLMHDTPTK